jgi:DNA-binding transcriptional regulator YiaG
MMDSAPVADIDHMTPAEVRALREAAGMTQDQLAEYLGLRHRSQVRHLESGRSKATGAKGKLLEQLRQRVEREKRRQHD